MSSHGTNYALNVFLQHDQPQNNARKCGFITLHI